MTAKEMFEKLGYELYTDSYYKISYKFKNTISDTYEIEFFKDKKEFVCEWYSDSPFEPVKPFNVTLQELQAINKQVEELGWNNE